MARVMYIGPSDAVEMRGVICPRNEPVDVADDVAVSLLEQPDVWADATKQNKTTNNKKAGVAGEEVTP